MRVSPGPPATVDVGQTHDAVRDHMAGLRVCFARVYSSQSQCVCQNPIVE